MEMLWFTLAAIALYAVSDWILNRIEIWRGARLENRSLVFFVIILVLSLGLFGLIRHWQPPSTPGADSGTGPETVGESR